MDYEKIINDVTNFEEFKLSKNKILSEGGPLFELQQALKAASADQKSVIGKKIHELKQELDQLFNRKQIEINQKQIQAKIDQDQNDIYAYTEGFFNFHPLYLVTQRMRQWFLANGYFEAPAIEIESDFYNFEQLNIPKNHPARDMQDSLYLSDSLLLRTHNTGVSARMLEKHANKEFACFTIGKVYRNDEDDQTHSHQFSQLDLIAVGEHNMQTLIWTLQSLLTYVFEQPVKIRMRPSFFPFTEPSMEVDVFYKNQWIEILGAGMINEKVLELAGYKKNHHWRAIAAGIGIERVAMIKYGIKDIREFFKNDLRMLKQFR